MWPPQFRIQSHFWDKIEKTEACWLRRGTNRGHGYGTMSIRNKTYYAHRFAYELLIGPIPDGLCLDHLCRNTLCVNPEHLEPVTNAENLLRGQNPWAINARKTYCQMGHPYDKTNTYVRPDGSRRCKICTRSQNNGRYHRKQKDRRDMLPLMEGE